MIDKAVYLAEHEDVTICSFGDMLRVPGSRKSLLKSKAEGADVRIVYSPLEAVKLAKENPDRQVIFFAVGFETTAPANGLSVIQASDLGLTNYSILTSHVLVPPAMEAILNDPENHIQGFLAAGHVCTVMGLDQYAPIVEKYQVPIVVTGFEPVDLLQGIYRSIVQLENGEARVENQYTRVVAAQGNQQARELIGSVFQVTDRDWRGIGLIPSSGYELNPDFSAFDANLKFKVDIEKVEESSDCIAGEVLRGLKKPHQCPQFGKKCTPSNPLGAPMVSSEGACAAYFNYAQYSETVSPE